jgi:hypothetical protein
VSSRSALGHTQPPIQWILPGVKRPGCEGDHSPRTSAEVKKTWLYTSTPPYIFKLSTGTVLPFYLTLSVIAAWRLDDRVWCWHNIVNRRFLLRNIFENILNKKRDECAKLFWLLEDNWRIVSVSGICEASSCLELATLAKNIPVYTATFRCGGFGSSHYFNFIMMTCPQSCFIRTTDVSIRPIKKVNLYLWQAVEAHWVVRRRSSHIFFSIGSQMAVTRWPPFTPWKIPGTHFWQRPLEGFGNLKKKNPKIFRLVA